MTCRPFERRSAQLLRDLTKIWPLPQCGDNCSRHRASGSKMGHIRHLFAGYSLFGFSLRVWGGMTDGSASGGSTVLRRRGCLVVVVALLAVAVGSDAIAQPRGSAPRSQQPAPPALPPSGHQTEPVDLNEGKSPAEFFNAGCAVCHQSANGLAKGRREGELTSFLRQHYTSSVQHAGALANFLASRPRAHRPSRRPRAKPRSTARRHRSDARIASHRKRRVRPSASRPANASHRLRRLPGPRRPRHRRPNPSLSPRHRPVHRRWRKSRPAPEIPL